MWENRVLPRRYIPGMLNKFGKIHDIPLIIRKLLGILKIQRRVTPSFRMNDGSNY